MNEVDAPDVTGVGYCLTVTDVIDETPDARSIVLRPAERDRTAFGYLPGQFLTFRIPSERTGYVARSYSLSSAPSLDEALKVTVKRVASGYGSNWLCDNLVPGSLVTVLPPAGRFTPSGYERELLLFAAGSGITPVMSILKTALLRGRRPIVLFYANRDPESVIFARELDELCAAHGDRLTVIHWYDSQAGFPTVEPLTELVEADPAREVYVCGPGPFMDSVAAAARAGGIPRERFHREVFTSLTGDPFGPKDGGPEPAAVVDDGAAPGPGADAGSVQATVHLDGEAHVFAWPAGTTLVEAMLERSIDVPYSCRSGECGSCVCRVTTGAVESANLEILDAEDRSEGYVLGCQSRPDSGTVEIEF